MKILSLYLTFFLTIFSLQAAEVDTIKVFSAAMNKDIKTVIISPEGVKTEKLPTLYLLHGFGGNYSNYANLCPSVKELVDRYKILVVCPDGGFGSWYWDVEGDKDFQYETFISEELVAHVNKNYQVWDDPAKRGITGFSMGGHGAMYLALRHQEVFGNVGCLAGGVDIRPFPNNWDMAKRLGAYADYPDKWNQYTVIELLHLIKPNSLQIFISCGRQDFFYQVNENLHQKLDYLNVPHHYHTMPGKHEWAYVNEAIRYQFEFFSTRFFTNSEA